MDLSADLEGPAGLGHLEAPSADPLLLDGLHSDKGLNLKPGSDHAALQIEADASDGNVLARNNTCGEAEGKDESFPDLADEESALDVEQIYDVQPRDINANLEWLQQRRRHAGASAVLLTSTVTGQGLQELMLEVDSMLQRRQAYVDTEQGAAVGNLSISKGRRQADAIDQKLQHATGSMVSSAA